MSKSEWFRDKLIYIEDELDNPGWAPDWAAEGIAEIEEYLAHHQTFAIDCLRKAIDKKDVEQLASFGLDVNITLAESE